MKINLLRFVSFQIKMVCTHRVFTLRDDFLVTLFNFYVYKANLLLILEMDIGTIFNVFETNHWHSPNKWLQSHSEEFTNVCSKESIKVFNELCKMNDPSKNDEISSDITKVLYNHGEH